MIYQVLLDLILDLIIEHSLPGPSSNAMLKATLGPQRVPCQLCDCMRPCCRYGKLNIQAGTQFCDKDFQEEVTKGKLSSISLDKYTCVALAGVTAEYLKYGRAEGGLGDVQQLDSLLRAIGVYILQLVPAQLLCSVCLQVLRKTMCKLDRDTAGHSSYWHLHLLCIVAKQHDVCHIAYVDDQGYTCVVVGR